MTHQITDLVVYNNDLYTLAAVSLGIDERLSAWPPSLFHPSEMGFEVVVSSTASTRGYNCTYEINTHGSLVMTSLAVSARRGGGVYEDLKRPIDCTGGIIIGQIHLGGRLSLPHDYRHVLELIFEQGQLVDAYDRSQAMERFREFERESRKARRRIEQKRNAQEIHKPLQPATGDSITGLTDWENRRVS